MRQRIIVAAGLAIGTGTVGLAFLKVVQVLAGLEERDLVEHPVARWVVYPVAGLYLIGIALIPIAVFWGPRETPANKNPMPWYGLFLVPLSMDDPSWTVPGWIKWPMLALLFALIGLVLYGAVFAAFNL